jgi:hypothetical protein
MLVLATPAASALEVRVSISPSRPAALERTVVVLNTFAPIVREDGSCCRLEPHAPRSYPFRVEAVSPAGKTSRIKVRHTSGNEWRGVVRFPRPGSWEIRLPQFFKTVRVRVGPPIPTPAPSGFGPLGDAGCAPPSPASPKDGFRTMFGTAVGDEQLWVLPFLPGGVRWADDASAVFEGLVGREMKIVFAMTRGREAPFEAIGPGGDVARPVWVRGHVGPTWVGIPGHQWGAGFVFPEPGCWRIRVGSRGDVWVLIRS